MTSEPPILEVRPPTAEEERLVQVLAEIETSQLEFLDQTEEMHRATAASDIQRQSLD